MWVKRHPFASVTSREHTFPEPNALMSSVVATATKTDVVDFLPHVVVGISPRFATTPHHLKLLLYQSLIGTLFVANRETTSSEAITFK